MLCHVKCLIVAHLGVTCFKCIWCMYITYNSYSCNILLITVITGWETANRYVVRNSLGQQVYFAAECEWCFIYTPPPSTDSMWFVIDGGVMNIIVQFLTLSCSIWHLCPPDLWGIQTFWDGDLWQQSERSENALDTYNHSDTCTLDSLSYSIKLFPYSVSVFTEQTLLFLCLCVCRWFTWWGLFGVTSGVASAVCKRWKSSLLLVLLLAGSNRTSPLSTPGTLSRMLKGRPSWR